MAYTDQKAAGESVSALQALLASPNIAADLPDKELATIAGRAMDEYRIDDNSRDDWKKRIEEAMKLAMLVSEQKDYPFEKAANIKYPLLTTAALQFNSRAYAAIVEGNRVAKCVTWGNDPDGLKQARADRVAEHLSYQLLAKMPEWEEDTDKLLLILPIVGCVFRKVYYDRALGRNCTRLVTADRMVVNYFARSMEDLPRSTEEMPLYPYEIEERIRSGWFVEFDYQNAAGEPKDGEQDGALDESAPHVFLEQHRLLDLDKDGYPEPYVVTIHKPTEKVCRIVANYTPETVSLDQRGRVLAIRKQDYYVKYQFLPSPDGGFYGWGFGWLLADIGEAINATLNQMLDAGHLSNVQGGLVSASLGIREKSIKLKMGEWKVLDTKGVPISQAVMPITYPGPSGVLFNLLGLLIEAGRDVAAIKDVLTGEQRPNQTATATLALIEQGLQVFTSIYKRIHRSLKKELGILARLNRENLDPQEYSAFFDSGQMLDPRQDYSERDMDILPVSDPNVASKMQQLAKAELLKEIGTENPVMNPIEVTRRVLEAAQIDDIDSLLLPPPAPDPETEILLKLAAFLDLQDKEAEVAKKHAGAMKDLASIEQGEHAGNMARAKLIFDTLMAEINAEQAQEAANGQGRVPGMEGQPGNAMGAPAPVGPDGGNLGALPGTAVQLDGAIPAGMGEPASAGGL